MPSSSWHRSSRTISRWRPSSEAGCRRRARKSCAPGSSKTSRKEETGDLVAEQDGRIVGAFQLVPVELSGMHVALARPDGAAFLGWAATRPDVRGSGAGVALTDAGFAWARERGYETMVTDWRVTNLLASRFWPRRGFRESFLRLYRRIP